MPLNGVVAAVLVKVYPDDGLAPKVPTDAPPPAQLDPVDVTTPEVFVKQPVAKPVTVRLVTVVLCIEVGPPLVSTFMA